MQNGSVAGIQNPRESSDPLAAFILAVNGGSSSIKFALYGEDAPHERLLAGRLEGIGLSKAALAASGGAFGEAFSRPVAAPNHAAGVALLMDWFRTQAWFGRLRAVGHRVVHGGEKYREARRVGARMISDLRRLNPLDPDHLPAEILLMEAFRLGFPRLEQVACFDTAFHRDLPPLARLLPIPRRYGAKGVRRYGFHGLSCSYLLGELERVAGPQAARGRVLLAHLGGGASVTAVLGGKSVDTSMGFSPTGGIPMGTRSGDLDPSLAGYLERTEKMTSEEFLHMVNHESGLLGVSAFSPDMRRLLAVEAKDARAAEAVALFCYETKKCVCALSGALGGLDTLVFAGGIGENCPAVRARVCQGLEFLGLALDESLNAAGAALISAPAGRVAVRVLRTDEEGVIAREAVRVLRAPKEEVHGHDA